LASLLGLRAGAVSAAYNSHVTNEFKPDAGEEIAITLSNEATRILRDWDAEKRKNTMLHFFPFTSESQLF
jgi:hypothetical protein